jgi:hypothetical protein
MSATGNIGSASSMGGGGNMSGQEMRGSRGLLDSRGPQMVGKRPLTGMVDEAQLRRMLAEMGIDLDALNGGGVQQPQPSSQPSNWSFPQYTQGWLPPTPAVPSMVPTPPFKRS